MVGLKLGCETGWEDEMKGRAGTLGKVGSETKRYHGCKSESRFLVWRQ